MVNSVTRQVLFGAQKQASRIIEALALFVDDYLKSMGIQTEDTPEGKTEGIKKALLVLSSDANLSAGLSVSDRMFASIILGPEAANQLSVGSTFGCECVSDTGKYVFYVRSRYVQSEWGPTSLKVDTSEVVREVKENSSKEDEAVALIERILKDCPNRSEYPEDDALAAILYGEIYWKKVD